MPSHQHRRKLDVLWMIIKSSWIAIYDADNLDFSVFIARPTVDNNKVSSHRLMCVPISKKGQRRRMLMNGRPSHLCLTFVLSLAPSHSFGPCLLITVTNKASPTREATDSYSRAFVAVILCTWLVLHFLYRLFCRFWFLRRVRRELWKQQKKKTTTAKTCVTSNFERKGLLLLMCECVRVCVMASFACRRRPIAFHTCTGPNALQINISWYTFGFLPLFHITYAPTQMGLYPGPASRFHFPPKQIQSLRRRS